MKQSTINTYIVWTEIHITLHDWANQKQATAAPQRWFWFSVFSYSTGVAVANLVPYLFHNLLQCALQQGGHALKDLHLPQQLCLHLIARLLHRGTLGSVGRREAGRGKENTLAVAQEVRAVLSGNRKVAGSIPGLRL